MTPSENLLRAMRRDNPAWVPFDVFLTPAMQDKYKNWLRENGKGDIPLEDYFEVSFRIIWPKPSTEKNGYSSYYKDLPANATIDDWGVANVPGSSYHFVHIISPLKDVTDPKVAFNYPMPDCDADYRWEHLTEQVKEVHNKGLAAVGWVGHIFETGWAIRGMEEMLIDFLTDNEVSDIILERIAAMNVNIAKRLASCGIDIIETGDDVGTQRGMMMSPEVWRKKLKPLHERVFQAAKSVNPDVLIWYHSDGMIQDIIPDLIEIGLDILNPVQPECIDPKWIKKTYGDKLSFWGCLGTQTTMPFGTADDVKNKVKELIRVVGKGGGLLIAPSHVLEPEVPWDNVLAFVETVKEHGKY